jgi:hypothetical protein
MTLRHSSYAAGALFMTKQPKTLHLAPTVIIMINLALNINRILTDVVRAVASKVTSDQSVI